MSITVVTWKEMMDEWHKEPAKLLAWLTKLFWDAEIEPEAPAMWLARMGEVRLGQSRLGHRVTLRLCRKCSEVLKWESVTGVPEDECQCICHKG